MKIKLLKDLPGVEVGTIIESDNDSAIIYFGLKIRYEPFSLIQEGWAEEVKEEEFWIPRVGENYFIIAGSITNEISRERVVDYSYISMSKHGLIFKTEEEAKKRLLFLELSHSNGGFIPKERESYFAICPFDGVIDKYVVTSPPVTNGIALGNCYETKEQANKYAPKWKEYFDLLKNK